MSFLQALRCVTCKSDRDPQTVHYTCPQCGDERGLLDAIYDYDAMRAALSRDALAADRDFTIRRYAALLPLKGDIPLPSLDIGGTPLYDVPSLATLAGVAQVKVKDDGRNPTASFKDRASAVALVRARELGAPLMTAASTGNAASSLAGLAAACGMPTVIFVPKATPRAKLIQLLVYGARVVTVQGTYDDAFEMSLRATRDFGWYNRNTGYNPYCLEGKKTAAFELAEQYAWDPPDFVFVPTGDGCIVAGIFKGFYDLLKLGWIRRMPRLVAVQAEGSTAIARGFAGGAAEIPRALTIADSISVARPRAALQAIRALRASKGGTMVVSDANILEALRLLARHSGVFAEPAAAASLAGLLRMRARGWLQGKERIALMVTGNGLKDTGAALQATDSTPTAMALDPAALLAYCRQIEQDLALAAP